jgi:hypothetical protein
MGDRLSYESSRLPYRPAAALIRRGGLVAACLAGSLLARPTATLGSVTSYADGRVTCTDREIIIRHYYPIGAKHIKYSAIREVCQVPLGPMGKWRIHGSGDLVHWFNFDPRRPRKDTALVIHLDGRVKPVITPDDPGRVAAELAAHGVNVTSGREAGLY